MGLCPNQHENLAGLSHCKVCGLPVLDLPAQFAALADTLASRAEMGRRPPHAMLVGIGTAGAGLIDIARAGHVGIPRDQTYLAIDANGAGDHAGSDVLRLTLGGSTPSAGTFCGIGEALVRNDPALAPTLRKAGLSCPDSGQTLFIVAALGGGIGSSVSAVAEKARWLNPDCHTVALVVVPGVDESFHNRLNAYYGLSRLLGHAADIVVAVHYDRMKRIKGVGVRAEELKTEGLLAAFTDLLIENLSAQSISEVVRINRSIGVTLVVPCLALGRSLEIFGNLNNILESAIAFPSNNVDKQSVLVCHLLLRVPQSRTGSFAEESVSEELAALVKRHLPNVKSTSLSITYSPEQHDRVDACLLLGGDSAMSALFTDGAALTEFRADLGRQASWQTYGLRQEDIRQAGEVLAQHDLALGRARGERKREVREPRMASDPDRARAVASLPAGGDSGKVVTGRNEYLPASDVAPTVVDVPEEESGANSLDEDLHPEVMHKRAAGREKTVKRR